MLKKAFNFLVSRMFWIGLLMLLQLGFLGYVIVSLSEYFMHLYFVLLVVSICVVVYIINRTDNPAYKLAWVTTILVFPIFGGLLYLAFGGKQVKRKLKRVSAQIFLDTVHLCQQDPEIIAEIEAENPGVANQVKYIANYAFSPIYKNTETEYLTPGEKFFERLLEELKKAEHFIFMEYFIVEEGLMWGSILDVMAQKAASGVEVRVMYDDAGTISTLSEDYPDVLRSLGIKCLVFNEVKPELNMRFNNRDHRKITVIDGFVGFTGGINLADEYINHIERFGHWKDAALWLRGEAVWNLTVMFLQLWNGSQGEGLLDNYENFRTHKFHAEAFSSDGFVQPYGDSPIDDESTGENVYLNIINRANEYVYINTPYLIVGNEVITALILAAKSGVDVRIVTPHIEDKWYAHIVTRAYYSQLVENGVKIYEYTPGFMHSKTFVCDNIIGVVGTINMDYRSLYLHFECGVLMYKSRAVAQIKQDFLETLEICTPMTLAELNDVKLGTRIVRSLLRVFAPMM